MNVIRRKIHTLFHTPRILMKKFARTPVFRLLPDKLALKIMYRNTFLKKLNLRDPKTFNEKLQWLKLYDRKPEYTMMVDKYAVKQYVASLIGEQYIIPTLGVWDRFEDIDFNTLPSQFVLKCTHGSGDVVICRDKTSFDKVAAREKLTKALHTNYYLIGREWPYKNVPRRIIAEKYMSNNIDSGSLLDYKMMCFTGKVKCCFVCSNRFSDGKLHVTFYDKSWAKLPFERDHPSEMTVHQKPENYEKMIMLAEKISQNLSFSRIDFYEVHGLIYFGEITFFPGGGFEKFQPDDWDFRLGDWLSLPAKIGA